MSEYNMSITSDSASMMSMMSNNLYEGSVFEELENDVCELIKQIYIPTNSSTDNSDQLIFLNEAIAQRICPLLGSINTPTPSNVEEIIDFIGTVTNIITAIPIRTSNYYFAEHSSPMQCNPPHNNSPTHSHGHQEYSHQFFDSLSPTPPHSQCGSENTHLTNTSPTNAQQLFSQHQQFHQQLHPHQYRDTFDSSLLAILPAQISYHQFLRYMGRVVTTFWGRAYYLHDFDILPSSITSALADVHCTKPCSASGTAFHQYDLDNNIIGSEDLHGICASHLLTHNNARTSSIVDEHTYCLSRDQRSAYYDHIVWCMYQLLQHNPLLSNQINLFLPFIPFLLLSLQNIESSTPLATSILNGVLFQHPKISSILFTASPTNIQCIVKEYIIWVAEYDVINCKIAPVSPNKCHPTSAVEEDGNAAIYPSYGYGSGLGDPSSHVQHKHSTICHTKSKKLINVMMSDEAELFGAFDDSSESHDYQLSDLDDPFYLPTQPIEIDVELMIKEYFEEFANFLLSDNFVNNNLYPPQVQRQDSPHIFTINCEPNDDNYDDDCDYDIHHNENPILNHIRRPHRHQKEQKAIASNLDLTEALDIVQQFMSTSYLAVYMVGLHSYISAVPFIPPCLGSIPTYLQHGAQIHARGKRGDDNEHVVMFNPCLASFVMFINQLLLPNIIIAALSVMFKESFITQHNTVERYHLLFHQPQLTLQQGQPLPPPLPFYLPSFSNSERPIAFVSDFAEQQLYHTHHNSELNLWLASGIGYLQIFSTLLTKHLNYTDAPLPNIAEETNHANFDHDQDNNNSCDDSTNISITSTNNNPTPPTTATTPTNTNNNNNNILNNTIYDTTMMDTVSQLSAAVSTSSSCYTLSKPQQHQHAMHRLDVQTNFTMYELCYNVVTSIPYIVHLYYYMQHMESIMDHALLELRVATEQSHNIQYQQDQSSPHRTSISTSSSTPSMTGLSRQYSQHHIKPFYNPILTLYSSYFIGISSYINYIQKQNLHSAKFFLILTPLLSLTFLERLIPMQSVYSMSHLHDHVLSTLSCQTNTNNTPLPNEQLEITLSKGTIAQPTTAPSPAYSTQYSILFDIPPQFCIDVLLYYISRECHQDAPDLHTIIHYWWTHLYSPFYAQLTPIFSPLLSIPTPALVLSLPPHIITGDDGDGHGDGSDDITCTNTSQSNCHTPASRSHFTQSQSRPSSSVSPKNRHFDPTLSNAVPSGTEKSSIGLNPTFFDDSQMTHSWDVSPTNASETKTTANTNTTIHTATPNNTTNNTTPTIPNHSSDEQSIHRTGRQKQRFSDHKTYQQQRSHLQQQHEQQQLQLREQQYQQFLQQQHISFLRHQLPSLSPIVSIELFLINFIYSLLQNGFKMNRMYTSVLLIPPNHFQGKGTSQHYPAEIDVPLQPTMKRLALTVTSLSNSSTTISKASAFTTTNSSNTINAPSVAPAANIPCLTSSPSSPTSPLLPSLTSLLSGSLSPKLHPSLNSPAVVLATTATPTTIATATASISMTTTGATAVTTTTTSPTPISGTTTIPTIVFEKPFIPIIPPQQLLLTILNPHLTESYIQQTHAHATRSHDILRLDKLLKSTMRLMLDTNILDLILRPILHHLISHVEHVEALDKQLCLIPLQPPLECLLPHKSMCEYYTPMLHQCDEGEMFIANASTKNQSTTSQLLYSTINTILDIQAALNHVKYNRWHRKQ